jgi:glutamyl-tRNA synthetase
VRRSRGRWAPSPTGWLHVGNARTALVAWLSVRAAGGTFAWRLEDLDPPRIVPGAAEAAMEDLAWLGLDWDEGPDVGGPHVPYRQSERSELYRHALEHLVTAGRLFPCRRSRKELTEIASAPHGPDGSPPYPKSLRPRGLAPDWFHKLEEPSHREPGASLRFLVRDSPVVFHDRVFGACTERVDETVGDFVLRRRDGLWAYQLAVVVDDLAMGITEVVRGSDLLGSTARQIQLFEALNGVFGGGATPAWAHVPLVLNAEGEKLSKRDRGLTLRSLRTAGARPETLVGWLGGSLGLLDAPEPCRAEELVPVFAWERIGREDWTLPPDFEGKLVDAR